MKKLNALISCLLVTIIIFMSSSYSFVSANAEKDGWLQLSNGEWQYVENGVPVRGWKNNIPGWNGWFYFDIESAIMARGWRNNIPAWNDKWFYFDVNSGIMAKDWTNNIPGWNDKWFYFDINSGVMSRGWQVDIPGWEGQRFYFDQTAGFMLVDQSIIDGEDFIFDPSGICTNVQDRNFIIVLDPGHSADDNGAEFNYDGVLVKEKDINMKIALALRNILQGYKTPDGRNVDVYLTHEIGPDGEESKIYNSARVQFAKDLDAQLLFSIHCNASSDGSRSFNGAMALITSSNYINPSSRFDEMYNAQNNIAGYVLNNFKSLGLNMSADPIEPATTRNDNGFLRRVCTDGSTYPNGEACDWYGIVMLGVQLGIPAIIAEHAYIDNEYDYYNYLNTDQKLENLAAADANALIQYYGLILK